MRKVRTALTLVAESLSSARRRRAIARSPGSDAGLKVYYGVDRVPGPDEVLAGGLVKAQRLAARLPNAPRDFNLLYLVSSARPRDTAELVRLARRRQAAFVWNQNGVAYAAWHGPGWEQANEPLASALHEADHVFFQSEFCRMCSDRFLGPRVGPAETLYNAVDTNQFTPATSAERGPGPVLLLAGNHHAWYRIEAALRTLALVRTSRPEARLRVAGVVATSSGDDTAAIADLVRELAIGDAIEFLGPYSQHQAPAIMRSADILVHPQYNDACPGVVIEALASGLPVVYSASGGVPELVGDAGAGVPAPLDFERVHPPGAAELSEAILAVCEQRRELSELARARAVERFDLRPWIDRHLEVFEEFQ